MKDKESSDLFEIIFDFHDKFDALVELLLEKGIITKAEFQEKLSEFIEKENNQ